MSLIRYWLWLSSAANVSARAKYLLVERYGGAEQAYFAPAGDFSSVQGISPLDAERLDKRDMSRVDAILQSCEEQGLTILTINDAAYPSRLKSIYDPPVVLYIKGSLPNVDDVPAFAVIGTRRATPYGLKMGRSIAYEIAQSGGIVISGLTSGIDAAAARGALLAGGTCIAVLGTAHEDCTLPLSRDVAASGALVSEYPPGTESQRSFFRARNRISSGLSVGVAVVEAPADSGALLFAATAQEQGREIFAVPGNADNPNSAGVIELLKQGARPAVCGWDIVGEYACLFPGKVADRISRPCPRSDIGETQSVSSAPKKEIDNGKPEEYIDKTECPGGLDEEQLKIVSAIDKDGTHVDDIIDRTGMSASKVLSQLTVLEILGRIKRGAGRMIFTNFSKK